MQGQLKYQKNPKSKVILEKNKAYLGITYVCTLIYLV